MISLRAELVHDQSPAGTPIEFFDDDACEFIAASTGIRETIGYVDDVVSIQGATARDQPIQTYVVRHSPQGARRATVLLCGSIGVERERAHRTIVDLACSLALAGVECFRFDYAGNGESTGRFDEQNFSVWRRQIELLAQRISASRECSPHDSHEPLVLWGVRAGALLASECFAAGIGDAAFLCAPLDGHALLNDWARRSQVAEMLAASRVIARGGASTQSRARRASDVLTAGESTSIDGYRWTPQFWHDAGLHTVALPTHDGGRARRSIELQAPRASLVANARAMSDGTIECDRFWESSSLLVPRTAALAETTLSFIAALSSQCTQAQSTIHAEADQ